MSAIMQRRRVRAKLDEMRLVYRCWVTRMLVMGIKGGSYVDGAGVLSKIMIHTTCGSCYVLKCSYVCK
jgi:hypothetical protein